MTNTKNVPLSPEELRFSKLRLDETEMQDIGLRAQLKMAEREIELNLPIRKANENLEVIKENIKRNKMNKDFYTKQIRDGRTVSIEKEKKVEKAE